MPDSRPNILWVSFEDTNPFYGCYGDPVARTPNVDRLAREGCRWPLAFAAAGVCAPARSAVITGMYPISIGTHHMRTSHVEPATPGLPTPYSAVVPHHVRCFTEHLRRAGYWCTNNDKTDYQFDPPFTAWDECSPHAHWRNRPDPAQPFFAVFNPVMSHESGMWPERTPQLAFDPATVPVPPIFPDTPKVREAMARMYTNIELADRVLGELLRQLEEDGLAERTLVVHWSDHGPLPRGKRWPYDAGIRVPMIARWPGRIAPGTVSDRLVGTIDLGPSMLSCAGIPIPPQLQGRAFLGPQEAAPRQYVFASRDRYDTAYDMVRAARDRRFKYIRNYRPELPYSLWIPYLERHPIMQELWRCHRAGTLDAAQSLLFQERRPVEELYDTQADPHEVRNLAAEPAMAGELVRLRAALDAWIAEVGDLGELDESQMVRRWYPDGKQPVTDAPIAALHDEANHGIEPVSGEVACRLPAALQLHSSTQGASIGYAIGDAPSARWQLYGAPIRIPPGETVLRAKAIRIGYRESAEIRLVLRAR